VALRLAILEQQNRRDDAAAFLLSLTRSTSSPELLEDLGAAAARLGFENVRESVLERQIALATDDVERIRLRLALARYYESKPDVAAARTVIEDVLRANPAILGVVRAATDFYWRNHLPEQAVDTLAAAARSSNAVFKKQFTSKPPRKPPNRPSPPVRETCLPNYWRANRSTRITWQPWRIRMRAQASISSSAISMLPRLRT